MNNLHKIRPTTTIPDIILRVAQGWSNGLRNEKLMYNPQLDILYFFSNINKRWAIFPKKHYKYWTNSRTRLWERVEVKITYEELA